MSAWIIVVIAAHVFPLQSTVNDVLDFQAMTNGKFTLTPKLTCLAHDILSSLQRCRMYMADDVTFQYQLPSEQVHIRVDMVRVSQILTNVLRCTTAEFPSLHDCLSYCLSC